MKIMHFLLFPFALIYSIGIKLWLWMHTKGYQGRVNFSVPIISVGNIQAGGTGKTPMVDYLCEKLSKEQHVSVLSRGYKRLTYGFRIVGELDHYKNVGDEPLWLKKRHPHVTVGVAENRVEGIPYLVSHALYTNLIMLDDGYQQLGIHIGVNILLTPYHRPYTRDYFLPAGRLREPRSSATRADVIIITKCPEDYLYEKDQVIRSLNITVEAHQQVFLSALYYGSPYSMFYEGSVEAYKKEESILLVTGIADAGPLKRYLDKKVKEVKHISYTDHYRFRPIDVEHIAKEYEGMSRNKIVKIVTTEKDAIRLNQYKNIIEGLGITFYVQPILLRIDDEVGLMNCLTDKIHGLHYSKDN